MAGMDGLMMSMLVVALFVAMGITLSEMRAALRPAVCPECSHCRQRLDEERRRQDDLQEAYELRWGLRDRDDEPHHRHRRD